MKTRQCRLVIVLFVLLSAPLVGADDQAASVESLKQRAAQGEAEAQLSLGLLYATGKSLPQDYAEALKWYRLAAAQGNAEAQFSLGVLYAKGEGVPQEDAEALKWYRLAAAQGNAGAQFNLGILYYEGQGVPQENVQAYKWLTLAVGAFTGKSDHDNALKVRDLVAARMTPAQIAEAQKLARDWKKQ